MKLSRRQLIQGIFLGLSGILSTKHADAKWLKYARGYGMGENKIWDHCNKGDHWRTCTYYGCQCVEYRDDMANGRNAGKSYWLSHDLHSLERGSFYYIWAKVPEDLKNVVYY